MLYFSKIKLIVIYLIIVLLSFFTLTNFVNFGQKNFIDKKVNLGLDLQGGSYLLLEIDVEPIIDQNLQRKFISLRNFFKKNNIKYKNFKLEDKAIFFNLEELDIIKFEEFFLNKDNNFIINDPSARPQTVRNY